MLEIRQTKIWRWLRKLYFVRAGHIQPKDSKYLKDPKFMFSVIKAIISSQFIGRKQTDIWPSGRNIIPNHALPKRNQSCALVLEVDDDQQPRETDEWAQRSKSVFLVNSDIFYNIPKMQKLLSERFYDFYLVGKISDIDDLKSFWLNDLLLEYVSHCFSDDQTINKLVPVSLKDTLSKRKSSYSFFISREKLETTIFGSSTSITQDKAFPMLSSEIRPRKGSFAICISDFNLTLPLVKQYSDIPVFTKNESPRVSIVIAAYNCFDHTLRCLNAIYENTDPNIPYEVILADDCSDDKTKDIKAEYHNLQHVRQRSNQGYLRNCNLAAQRARGKFLLLLNNDTIPQPGWLSSLLKTKLNHPSTGIVGSKLVTINGGLQEAGGIIWKNALGFNVGRDQKITDPQYNYVREVDYVSAAALLIEVELWEKLGGFDERYGQGYYEDTDLCFRVKERELKVLYQPKSIVVHAESATFGDAQKARLLSKNIEIFKGRWAKRLLSSHNDPCREVLAINGSKPIAIVVDLFIPDDECNAGAKHTLCYMRILLDLGYAVKLICLKLKSERDIEIHHKLTQVGIEIHMPSFFDDEIDVFSIIDQRFKHAALLMVNRLFVANKLCARLKSFAGATIYFAHDLNFLRLERAEKLTGRVGERKVQRADEISVIKTFDVTVTPSKFEVELLRTKYGLGNVRHLPIWSMNFDPGRGTPSQNILFVGNENHKPNVDGLKWFLEEIWPLLIRQRPDLVFEIVGGRFPTISYLLDNVVLSGRVSAIELEEKYKNTPVVIVPLRYGAGVKGKVVEALSFGCPVVSTPVGIEGLDNLPEGVYSNNAEDRFAESVLAALDLSGKQLIQIRRSQKQFIDDNFSRTYCGSCFAQAIPSV